MTSASGSAHRNDVMSMYRMLEATNADATSEYASTKASAPVPPIASETRWWLSTVNSVSGQGTTKVLPAWTIGRSISGESSKLNSEHGTDPHTAVSRSQGLVSRSPSPKNRSMSSRVKVTALFRDLRRLLAGTSIPWDGRESGSAPRPRPAREHISRLNLRVPSTSWYAPLLAARRRRSC